MQAIHLQAVTLDLPKDEARQGKEKKNRVPLFPWSIFFLTYTTHSLVTFASFCLVAAATLTPQSSYACWAGNKR